MASSQQTPIVIGVGDIVNRSLKVEDAIEPLQLILEAIQTALKDSGLSASGVAQLHESIDSVAVVRTWTWPYEDLSKLLAEKLGVSPKYTYYSEHGGNSPGKIFDEAARRISQGQSKVAVVTGGEALASLNACANAKKLPPPGWSQVNEKVDSVFSPTTRALAENLGSLHSIGAPIHIYPLYENGFRAYRGQSIRDNNKESAELYAEFAEVAEKNPYSWNYGKPAGTVESIGNVTKRNRMICYPYPLLMNAFNTVNLAGAAILTSESYARELGIPKNKWVYPLGGAGTQDSADFWLRPDYHSSPCISASIDAALEVSGLTKEEIDLYDFYSCFPIVPKLASQHLGLPLTKSPKPITLLGGLTSFGGAGNNYSMHAITEMTRAIRRGKSKIGLVLCNGGVVTYQHVLCLSSKPRRDGSIYPQKNILPYQLKDRPVPSIASNPQGEATIETYTVEFNRDGSPLRGHIVGRLQSSGERFLANHADFSTLNQLCSDSVEPIGRTGYVSGDPKKNGHNLFSFTQSARL